MVPQVSNPHHFKESSVCLQDVVTTRLQQYTLPDLGPRLQVSEPQALVEVSEEVHQPKLHQQISDLLNARVLGLFNVGVEIP